MFQNSIHATKVLLNDHYRIMIYFNVVWFEGEIKNVFD